MKCLLKINISHVREALECENRYELRATIDFSHAREALKCENHNEMRSINRC